MNVLTLPFCWLCRENSPTYIHVNRWSQEAFLSDFSERHQTKDIRGAHNINRNEFGKSKIRLRAHSVRTSDIITLKT